MLELVELLTSHPWPYSSTDALELLHQVGFGGLGEVEHEGHGAVQNTIVSPAGIDHASFCTFDDLFMGLFVFTASAPEGESPSTARWAYDHLIKSISTRRGPPTRVWDNEPTPVHWVVSNLEIGLQLFDRRNSTVMGWVEHRDRAALVENRSRTD